jgi:prolyl-tRNA editing enzyme YbaK/EbsC (Cys-tRNA(Pro) deacylase)
VSHDDTTDTTDMTDTADIEQRVRSAAAASRTAGVEVIECDPDLADTAAFCEAYGYSPEDSANAIVVIGKSDPPTYAVCVVLATTRLDVNRVVRKRLGTKKASFAGAGDTEALTGMTVGGVTPFGLPPGLPLWIDAAVMHRERIVVGGGSRSCKVVGPPQMLLELPDVEVVDGLATPAGVQ